MYDQLFIIGYVYWSLPWKTVDHLSQLLIIGMKDCRSCTININHCHESLLIMYHNCWSLDERLLIMYDKHRSLDERLLIMYDKHWSSDERLLIMYDKHWSLPWKLVDHVWCITKSYHHESYRDHYLVHKSGPSDFL